MSEGCLPLVSIIVPVYNVEKYIEKCLDSIINQTYNNLEIILVDDGSTDDSGLKCEQYSEIDDRIIVIHKKNGGLSDARNTALSVFTGEFVAFVDSDDYLDQEYIEYLYKLIVNNNADISVCQYTITYSTVSKKNRKTKETIKIFNRLSAIENTLYHKCIPVSAFGKLYKREIFDSIKYPYGYYYEDLAVIVYILNLCSKIVVSNQKKYYYIQRKDSIMNGKFSIEKMRKVKISKDHLHFIESNYPDLAPAARFRLFLSALQTYRIIPFDSIHKDLLNEIWMIIISYRKEILHDEKVEFSYKIMALISYFGRDIFKLFGEFLTIKKNAMLSIHSS